MTRRCVIHNAARHEIDDQADYLAKQAGNRIAGCFLECVDRTISKLAATPGRGSLLITERYLLQGIRKIPVVRFRNYLLFYRYDEARIEVLHLFHAKQDIESRLSFGEVDEDVDDDQ